MRFIVIINISLQWEIYSYYLPILDTKLDLILFTLMIFLSVLKFTNL